MMVAGAGCVVFGLIPYVMSVVFALGTVFFALMQMSMVYEGKNITIKRLRHLMVISDIVFIISGLLMVENVYHFFFPFIATSLDGYNTYVQIVHNNWVVALLIAAVIEVYTTHRISYELKKEESL